MSRVPVTFGTVVALIVGALLLPACRPLDSRSEAERSSASVAIYAAATRQLSEVDNTFGGPGYRFSEVLVVDRIQPDAGDYRRQGPPGDPLTGEQRAAVAAAIEPLSPVRFIADPSEFIQQSVLLPVIPGSAIVTLGPLHFDRKGAKVGMNLWCGGICGIWLTYRVTEGPDGWTVVGTEGEIAIY